MCCYNNLEINPLYFFKNPAYCIEYETRHFSADLHVRYSIIFFSQQIFFIKSIQNCVFQVSQFWHQELHHQHLPVAGAEGGRSGPLRPERGGHHVMWSIVINISKAWHWINHKTVRQNNHILLSMSIIVDCSNVIKIVTRGQLLTFYNVGQWDDIELESDQSEASV